MANVAIEQKLAALQDLLRSYGRVAIGFSGGVDSTFLAAVCQQVMPADTLLAHLTTPLIGSGEQGSFKALTGDDDGADAKLANLATLEIKVDQLQNATVAANDPDRCYHCKKLGFTRIVEEASRRGFSTVIDGSNASDAGDYRPGMRAVEELGVRSPLQEVGFVKDEERELLRTWGFDVWNMPSSACLATRVPTGEPLTREKIEVARAAEDLLHGRGLVQVRARLITGTLVIEAGAEDLDRLVALGGTRIENGQVELPKALSAELGTLGAQAVEPTARLYGKGNMNAASDYLPAARPSS